MISGTNNFKIRKATLKDLEKIKMIADAHRNELGFVLKPALARSINKNEVLLAESGGSILGFVEYHHRKDYQTTLYNIAIINSARNSGIGKALINSLYTEAKNLNKHFILLKCPVDLPANRFYKNIGFQLLRHEKGKKRALSIFLIKVS